MDLVSTALLSPNLAFLDRLPGFIYAILGVGFLIFVHELGHFLAAKRCGIRVDTFALGFQPTVFGYRMRFLAFTKGETEYVIGMIPFGGYVKMAGEELEDEKTGSSDEYASKSASERALVLVAGSAMNIIFAFIFFVVSFAIGVKFQTTEIGSVLKASPAWHAGVRPGDRIVQVDGREMADFMELNTTLALGGLGRAIPVTIERPQAGSDEALDVELELRQAFDRAQGRPVAGVMPVTSRQIAAVDEGSVAANAGITAGDTIVQVAMIEGEKVTAIPREWVFNEQWSAVENYLDVAPTADFQFTLSDANGVERVVRVTPKQVAGETPILGIGTPLRTIMVVRKGTETVLQPGVEIVALNGQNVGRLNLATVLRASPSMDSTVTMTTASGTELSATTRQLIEWLRFDVVVGSGGAKISAVKAGSVAAKLGLGVGDQLLTLDDRPFQGGATDNALDPKRLVHAITWRSNGEVREASLEEDSLGLELELRPVVVGQVTVGSGAESAGLALGDVIRGVGGDTVREWSDLLAALAKLRESNAKSTTVEVLRGGEVMSLDVPLRPRSQPVLGLGLRSKQQLRQEGILDACVVGSEIAWVWAKRIILTLRALVLREVSAKNLSGPLGIVNVTKLVSEQGFGNLIFILAVISLNLGMFNLFPFPILDGGHLLFLAIEKLKGSPVSEKVQYYAHLGAFVMLISLALFVTYHDILRWRW